MKTLVPPEYKTNVAAYWKKDSQYTVLMETESKQKEVVWKTRLFQVFVTISETLIEPVA